MTLVGMMILESYTGGEDDMVVGTEGRHVLDDTVESDTGGEDGMKT